jgi:hypothetical protein
LMKLQLCTGTSIFCQSSPHVLLLAALTNYEIISF